MKISSNTVMGMQASSEGSKFLEIIKSRASDINTDFHNWIQLFVENTENSYNMYHDSSVIKHILQTTFHSNMQGQLLDYLCY